MLRSSAERRLKEQGWRDARARRAAKIFLWPTLGPHSAALQMARCMAFFALVSAVAAQHVVPGKVKPTFPHTYDMARSSGMMTCNSSGAVDPTVAAKWGLIDLGALI